MLSPLPQLHPAPSPAIFETLLPHPYPPFPVPTEKLRQQRRYQRPVLVVGLHAHPGVRPPRGSPLLQAPAAWFPDCCANGAAASCALRQSEGTPQACRRLTAPPGRRDVHGYPWDPPLLSAPPTAGHRAGQPKPGCAGRPHAGRHRVVLLRILGLPLLAQGGVTLPAQPHHATVPLLHLRPSQGRSAAPQGATPVLASQAVQQFRRPLGADGAGLMGQHALLRFRFPRHLGSRCLVLRRICVRVFLRPFAAFCLLSIASSACCSAFPSHRMLFCSILLL